jgi:hypothetical protein
MASRRELYEARGRRNAAAERAARRRERWRLVRAGLACVGWCAAGLYLVAWSLHTTDEQAGRVAFWAGLLVGNGGIIATLLTTLGRRAEDDPG